VSISPSTSAGSTRISSPAYLRLFGLLAISASVLAYVLVEIMPALWNLGAVSLVVPLAVAGAFGLALHPRRGELFAVAWATLELVVWGGIVWGLMAISPIAMLRWNEVCLVFLPIDIVLPFLGPSKRRIYARGRLVLLLLVSMLCAIDVLPQPLWIPILVAVMPFFVLAFDLPRSPSSTPPG
jgi:hypothetical protein